MRDASEGKVKKDMEDKNPRLTLMTRGSIICINIGNRACGLSPIIIQVLLFIPSSIGSSRRFFLTHLVTLNFNFPYETDTLKQKS